MDLLAYYIGSLRVCGNIGDILKEKPIRSQFRSKGLLEKNVVIGNALIDMYVWNVVYSGRLKKCSKGFLVEM